MTTTTRVNYFAGRMHKLKSHDVKGMQIHNQREKESQSNKTIDKTKTVLNYDLVNEKPIDYKEKIDQRIKEAVESKRKTRKDAVLCNQWIITSDKTFFDRIGPDEEKRFFQESYKWFAERYGKKNVIFATVHKDEHTPHMHLGIIPIKDGRLSSKDLFNRVQLKEIQDKFPKYIQSLGFNLERGIPNKQQHMEPVKFKNMQLLEQQKKIMEELKAIKEIDQSIDSIPVKDGGLFKKGKVEVNKKDWEHVKNQAKKGLSYKYELEKIRKEMDWLQKRNDLLEPSAKKYNELGHIFGHDRLEKMLDQGREKERSRDKQLDMDRDL